MTQYNIKRKTCLIHNLNKLKSGIKNATEVTLNLSSNVIGNSNDKINVSHKL